MPAPAREGEILDGKYRILRKLGEGGMGAVYAGEHVRVKKSVAIKVLHAGASAVEEMADRFEREAQAAGQIGNDHIVEVFDLGATRAGERYMVMEYLEGESLRSRIKRQKRMTFAEIGPLLSQMLEGLEAAHRAGIIHRDLKPDNIFIVRAKAGRSLGEFVKILDFGISKFTALGEGSTTRTGTVMGSPNYMSPEHVRSSAEVDARSDLYAVGIMLYEALTGVVPRKAPNFAELLFKIAYEPMPDPRALVPGLAEAIVALIYKICATDRNARFTSAAELQGAIDSLVASSGPALYLAGPPSAPRSSGSGAHEPETLVAFTPSSGGLNPRTNLAEAPSQPSSVAGASLPGFSSNPEYTSQPAFSSQAAAGTGATSGIFIDPETANGTAVISLPDGAGPPDKLWPLPAGSQPSSASQAAAVHGSSSQPSYGSQPGFGSQPNVASQPSFGNGSQPSMSGLGTPGFVSVGGGTAASMTLAQGGGAPPGRNSAALFAVVFAAVLGVGGAVLYIVTVNGRGAVLPASSTARASESTRSTAVAAATPPTAETSAAAALDSALSAASASSAPESSNSTASAKPSAIRVGPRPKVPDPGY